MVNRYYFETVLSQQLECMELPYSSIAMTHLTARSTKGDDAQTMDAESVIGFRQE